MALCYCTDQGLWPLTRQGAAVLIGSKAVGIILIAEGDTFP